MTNTDASAWEARHDTDRVIGAYGDDSRGPLLVVIAGLHGNEPAGVEAARNVFAVLAANKPDFNGRFMAFIGNTGALAQGKRFIQRDMNRVWAANAMDVLRKTDPQDYDHEQREQSELLACVEPEIHRDPKRRIIVIDLHSTSADAPPFCIISDTMQNRRVAFAWSLPVILGLEEAITGTVQEYFGDKGFVTVAVEGGRHLDERTSGRLESILWLTLVSEGFLSASDVPDLKLHNVRLNEAARGLPRVVEVFYRRGIEPGEDFRMVTRFTNFHPVGKDEVVATSDGEEVCSPADGVVVLPNHLQIGDDGFFVGRKVRRFWLRLSTAVRKLRVDRLLHILPGVTSDPDDDSVVLVDPGVARWLVLQIFHLGGFRRCAPRGASVVFRRRVEQQDL